MKKIILMLCCQSLMSAAVAGGNPASMEYVNQRIQAAVSQLQTQMNTIPQGKQGPPGPQGAPGEQGAAGNYIAGPGLVIEGNTISLKTTHQIGEPYQGGMVFWVDKEGQHGLVAALEDAEDSGIQWQNGESGEKRVNATGNGIGAGDTNTQLIIAQQTIDDQSGQFAALAAANFQAMEDGKPCPSNTLKTCYGGWYLPSLFELRLIHQNLIDQGLIELQPQCYWSSTEGSVTQAWCEDFASGQAFLREKSDPSLRVRAIHSF